MELQRVQYESDYETALVNSRTAKITLLMLLNDRTPVDHFDVTGPFEFSEPLTPLEEFHTMALDARPDLQAAVAAVDKAGTDHKLAVANGSTDPTFGVDFGRNPPIPAYIGLSVNIPAAHLRPQPGREGAHRDRYQARRDGCRTRPRRRYSATWIRPISRW